jgi:protein-S-isoprenylcysteine O-methyltransferase Ste14
MGLVSSFQLKFFTVLTADFSNRSADLFSLFLVAALLLMALLRIKREEKNLASIYGN